MPLPREIPVGFDHLGVAVPDIDAACRLYAALGLVAGEREVIAHEQVTVAMLPLAHGRLELLEPTSAESPVGRFLAKRGAGIHHVALRVADLAATVERLQAAGVRLVHATIQIGTGGHRYVFVHPSSNGGVLLELVEGEP